MKSQKFIFYRYSFQEDPDSIPEKRVAIEEVGMHFGNLFHVGEKLTMYMKKVKLTSACEMIPLPCTKILSCLESTMTKT